MNNYIFIINHSVKNCGVYQYGKRFADILLKSDKYIYLEINSQEELELNINKYNPKLIIYNHLTGTMPWANEEFIKKIRNKNIKQGTIVHNKGYSTYFDFYLHQDPNYEVNNNNYNLLRPLFSSYLSDYIKDDNITRIGSFGFGFRSKFYPEICSLVNSQANDFESIEINLHLTFPHFCEADVNGIIHDCKNQISATNISLNITSNFLETQEMLDFLARNDLNIFFYQNYHEYNGISSVIDYALSVKKPLAICKSNMFSHIWNSTPSICIEDRSLKQIIDTGITPLKNYYETSSN
jgi:hypothetical protein